MNTETADMNADGNAAGQPDGKARYVMVGGFLGSGKTTSIGKLAEWLTVRGRRVGLITNDQGSALVDTVFLQAKGYATREITGGCFCCRFNSLTEAASALTKESRPDVFIAEPVGSCTDLVATVSYPLRRLYGDAYEIAPLSVLVDPIRAMRIFGLESGRAFSPKVVYIYRKQLEEADVIVVNKMDLISNASWLRLREALENEFPAAHVLGVSARTEAGLADWFELVDRNTQRPRPAMDVDYEIYAEGEALLGWLNATIRLKSKTPFDANRWMEELASDLQGQFQERDIETAHLKMTLDPGSALGEIAVLNLVRNDFKPEASQRLDEPVLEGELILNLRAEGDPEQLRALVHASIEAASGRHEGLDCATEHLESFRPGKPTPTHRMAMAAEGPSGLPPRTEDESNGRISSRGRHS